MPELTVTFANLAQGSKTMQDFSGQRQLHPFQQRQGARLSPVASRQFHTWHQHRERADLGRYELEGAPPGGAQIQGVAGNGKDSPQILASHHLKRWS